MAQYVRLKNKVVFLKSSYVRDIYLYPISVSLNTKLTQEHHVSMVAGVALKCILHGFGPNFHTNMHISMAMNHIKNG